MDRNEKLQAAKEVFQIEIKALQHICAGLEETFAVIEEAILSCSGKVILCGMGKSGHIARKISATLASLGTPSFFLHPAEAVHGDLGMVSENDIVLLLSSSGETQELIQIIPSLKQIGSKIIAVTCRKDSTLVKESDYFQVLDIGQEAGYLRLAPTSSTTAMLVYGDALASVAAMESGFGATDFGRFHPAGTLGKKVLARVRKVMAQGEDLPAVCQNCRITDAILEMSRKGLGVVAITDPGRKLTGLLTDGDLRRAIEKKADLYGDIVDSIMTQNPKYIEADLLLVDVLKKLRENRLNNYPVVDREHRLIGMVTWQMIIREGIVL